MRRSDFESLLEQRRVLVDGKQRTDAYQLSGGETIVITPAPNNEKSKIDAAEAAHDVKPVAPQAPPIQVSQTPHPTQGKSTPNIDEVKRMLRKSSGARDFLRKSQRAGFSVVEESAIGLVIKRNDCHVIFAVIPEYGEDKIRRLSMQEKGGQALHLIEDGEYKFDDTVKPLPIAISQSASARTPNEPTPPSDANALLLKGALFHSGQEVTQDYREALKWFRLAADQGNARAQNWVGTMYYIGQGVPKDYQEALKWFRFAADQGDAEAQKYVGVIYDNGQGVPRDPQKALKWFRLAADQGDAGGQFCLGVMYRDGRGVAQDYKEGLKWTLLAAKKGNAEAQYNLGVMYSQGIGVPKNIEEGVKWLGCAAAQGHSQAKHNLAVATRSGKISGVTMKSANCSKHPSKLGLKAQCCICKRVPLCEECLRTEMAPDFGGETFYCSDCRPNARKPRASTLEFVRPEAGWQPPE